MATNVKVLLVDDNPMILGMLKQALSALSTVTTATDAADALLKAVDESPDLLVCDYRLPGMDGRQLVEKLKSRPTTAGVAIILLARMFIENRRWSRIFKMQSDVHGRLIERFTTNQELASYMQTDAGRKFLEAAPLPVAFEQHQRVPSAIARILTPLQTGIVMVLLGIGLLLLRNAGPDMNTPMLFFGTVVLMPGIGFIISAGASWFLASRLGLMPNENSRQDSALNAAYRDR